ncbi:ABC transporter permease [uncultured Hyphomonas sp.]|uniref:ABC transporter permease n=1 Tax=uncultured Hyphomonas sp. TaxID=225298 RepID=UPI002AAA8FC4|nr:ABC transporter permease [uncultured Hyphomonas sp.]
MKNIYLVFRRDYLGYVKAWGFWLSLAAVPALMLIGSMFALFAAQSSPVRYYTVIEPGQIYAEAIDAEFANSDAAAMAQDFADQMQLPDGAMGNGAAQTLRDRKFIEVTPPAETIDGLRPYLLGERLVSGPQGDKPLFAAFILSDDGETLEYWSDDVNINSLRYEAQDAVRRLARTHALEAAGLGPDFIQQADDAAVQVPARRIRSVAEQETTGVEVTLADRAPVFVAGALAYFLWLMVFSIIQYLLMGTIEERSNKIFDTLLTSVRMPELLAGKLLAVFAVTSTMMLVWGLFALSGSAFLATQVPGAGDMITPFLAAAASPQILVPALFSFVLGYIMYGMIFMALGSLCDTIQEAQTLLSPMMILLMLPMFAIFIAFQDPGSPVVDFATWVPVFTPFLLILRMPHDPPMWEVAMQMGLMVVTTLAVLWVSVRVYRAGAVNGASIGDLGKMLKGIGRKKSN